MHVALVNCVLLWWTQVASCANHYRNLMIMVTYVIVKDSFNLVNSPPWATGITFWLNSESSTHRLTLASFWSQLSVSSLKPRLFHSGFLSRSFGEKSEGKPGRIFHVIRWHCDVHQSTRHKDSTSHRMFVLSCIAGGLRERSYKTKSKVTATCTWHVGLLLTKRSYSSRLDSYSFAEILKLMDGCHEKASN